MLHVNDARTRERRGATDEKQIAACVQFVFFFFFDAFLAFLPIPSQLFGFSNVFLVPTRYVG